MIKRYIITNRITKERMTVDAQSAQEACEKCGWMVGNCWVRGWFSPHGWDERLGGKPSNGKEPQP